jgi:hypothetical protein
MGAGTIVSRTDEVIQNEVAAFTACLPMAEQLNGGIIQLSVADGTSDVS